MHHFNILIISLLGVFILLFMTIHFLVSVSVIISVIILYVGVILTMFDKKFRHQKASILLGIILIICSFLLISRTMSVNEISHDSSQLHHNSEKIALIKNSKISISSRKTTHKYRHLNYIKLHKLIKDDKQLRYNLKGDEFAKHPIYHFKYWKQCLTSK